MRRSCVCGGQFLPIPPVSAGVLQYECFSCHKVVRVRPRGKSIRSYPLGLMGQPQGFRFDVTMHVDPRVLPSVHATLAHALNDAARRLGLHLTISETYTHPFDPE